jgi:tetratricopeptide (TPR) repeat protein
VSGPLSGIPSPTDLLGTPSAGLFSPPVSAPRPRRWLRALLLLPLLGLVAAGGWLWYAHQLRQEWRHALTALQRHDLASAAAHLDRYLQRQPHDTAAWFLAGRTARRRGNFPEAERYLTRCQHLGGVTEATRLEWDLLRVQQGGLGEVDQRLRLSTPPEHPDAPLVLEALAQGYRKRDRLRDALEACDLWTSCQPDHPWPWLWRGEIFEQLGHTQQAVLSYLRALENAPEDRAVRLALGRRLAGARQPAAAIEHFEHLLARSPDDPEVLLGLAGCRIEQGRSEEAVALLERVLANNSGPLLAQARFLRGKAALQQNEAAAAERWLTQAVRQAPDEPEALHQLTLALRLRGKHAEADRLVPRLDVLRQNITRLTELTALIARDPNNARPRHEAGVLSLRLGRSDEGVRWLQSALQAQGDHRPTHTALAEHFHRLGDPRAELHRRQAENP